ncbi:hypothetical protein V8B97DRAFT_2021036 [Scleroderma yunnanense]
MPKAYPCNCKSYNCNGKLVDYDTRHMHEHTDLWQRTSASQGIHHVSFVPQVSSKPPPLAHPYPTRGPILPHVFDFPDPLEMSPSAVKQQMLNHGMLTPEDINLQLYGNELPNLGPNFHSPEALLDTIDYYDTYNAVTAADEEIPDVDFDIEDHTDFPNTINLLEQLEDDPDPFQVDDNSRSCINFKYLSAQPTYLLIIYMMMTWLHLQWHLPHAACNAVLSILSCLLFTLCPTLLAPFVTLPLAMKVLGLNLQTHKLPCWPSCHEVYLPAGSLHMQDECIMCKILLFLPDQTKHGLLCSKKISCVKYPYLSLSDQIQSILMIPGIEESLDAWHTHPHTPGHYSNIFDELQISVTLGMDWFSYIHNNITPSHSSCPTSFSICNLPPEYSRYHTSNLLLTSILPGPKEQNPDDDFPTPSCPDGCLVCVVLVAIVCDKPAAHKIGGFASHSCTFFCHGCWICQVEKDKAKVFFSAFQAHTNAEQQELGEHYHQLTTAAAHKDFTQFYNIWVQGKILHPNHELWVFHNLLADFKIPVSCGKLPMDIGIPAGRSLTTDQWLLPATIYRPIAIPHLWNIYLLDAQQHGLLTDCVTVIAKQKFKKACISAEKAAVEEVRKTENYNSLHFELAKLKGKPSNPALGTFINDTLDESVTEIDKTDGKCILYPNDPANFLKLCAAIHLLIKKTITNEEISSVDVLLREYCMELIQLFRTFLFKCLNKILKSFKTNNHSDGELETTFFNEFHKTCQSSRQGCKVSDIMVKASAEKQGTVVGLAALSKDLNEVHNEDCAYGLSPHQHLKPLPYETYKALAHVICLCIALDHTATFFDYMIMDSQKNSSLIHVVIPQKNGQPLVDAFGEILEIFRFDQDIQYQGQSMYFVCIEREHIWHTFGNLVGVWLWELEGYIGPDTLLLTLIDPQWIYSQILLKTVSVGVHCKKVWAIVELVNMCTQYIFSRMLTYNV